MKNLYLYLWGAIVAMFTLNACTDEANLPVPEEKPQEESSLCTFTIPEVPVHGIDGSSRTATTLAISCYRSMFSDCTSLETAPVLPAETLVESCYGNMFYGCSKLNSVTMLATDIRAEGCLEYWLEDVASEGTFYKAAEMDESAFSRDPGGIPTGWEVENYTE